MTEKKEKKGCCCCKKKPAAKKRKATVGKGKKTAKQIVNAPMPMMRPSYEPYLYSAHAEGERQRFAPKNEVTIPAKEFVKEHVSLVDILKSGTKSEQQKEATSQQKELKKVMAETGTQTSIKIPKKKLVASMETQTMPVLEGINIPIKREGMYIKKKTGLFAPEERGAPTKEERIMREMVGQTKLDKFFNTLK